MENRKENTNSANDLVYFLISLCLFIVMALLTTDGVVYSR